MKDRPILVKPYYRLDEVVERLILARVSLNKPEDILLLARKKEIEVNLLCDEEITLINTRYATYIDRQLPESILDEDLSKIGYGPSEMDSFKKEFVQANWLIAIEIDLDSYTHLICNPFKSYDIKQAERQSISKIMPFFTRHGNIEPLVLKPLSLDIEDSFSPNNQITESSWLAANGGRYIFEYRCVVEIEGENFYVCQSMAANPYSHNLKGSVEYDGQEKEYKLRYRLDDKLIESLIDKNNFVVTKEELQRYEQKFLLAYSKDPDDNKGRQERREKFIKQYLASNTQEYIKTLSLQEVWSDLKSLDSELFKQASNRTIGDCFTRCRQAGTEFPVLK